MRWRPASSRSHRQSHSHRGPGARLLDRSAPVHHGRVGRRLHRAGGLLLLHAPAWSRAIRTLLRRPGTSGPTTSRPGAHRPMAPTTTWPMRPCISMEARRPPRAASPSCPSSPATTDPFRAPEPGSAPYAHDDLVGLRAPAGPGRNGAPREAPAGGPGPPSASRNGVGHRSAHRIGTTTTLHPWTTCHLPNRYRNNCIFGLRRA